MLGPDFEIDIDSEMNVCSERETGGRDEEIER